MNNSEIKIYQLQDGNTEIQVKIEQESVWLNLMQMTELFQRNKSVISRHIGNVFKEGELSSNSTVANFATVQKEGQRKISRKVEYYNLDVIISVGYRIKSQRGTQFRIWANQILKDYLVKGFALNENQIIKQNEQLQSLKEAVKLIGNVLNFKQLTNDENKGLLKIISDYAYALDILDGYDYQSLNIDETRNNELYIISYEDAINQINRVKVNFKSSSLFGREKDNSFKSSISTIYQTLDGIDLYPSIEEKAANLLYFITKNHSFTDGNKRIAAFLFLYFMEKNGILYNDNKTKRIADNALVAITLMIAVSKPEEKETIIKVVVNLINKKN